MYTAQDYAAARLDAPTHYGICQPCGEHNLYAPGELDRIRSGGRGGPYCRECGVPLDPAYVGEVVHLGAAGRDSCRDSCPDGEASD